MNLNIKIFLNKNVEDGGRWSKPHVAALSLHSLLELRNCLTNGAVLLDILGDDLDSIVENILDRVIDGGFLDESKREIVKNTLMLKHVHQHEKEFQKLQRQISGDKRQFPMIKSFADITSVNNIKTPSSSDLQRFNSSPSSNFLTINGINSVSKSNFDVLKNSESKVKVLKIIKNIVLEI